MLHFLQLPAETPRLLTHHTQLFLPKNSLPLPRLDQRAHRHKNNVQGSPDPGDEAAGAAKCAAAPCQGTRGTRSHSINKNLWNCFGSKGEGGPSLLLLTCPDPHPLPAPKTRPFQRVPTIPKLLHRVPPVPKSSHRVPPVPKPPHRVSPVPKSPTGSSNPLTGSKQSPKTLSEGPTSPQTLWASPGSSCHPGRDEHALDMGRIIPRSRNSLPRGLQALRARVCHNSSI